MPVGVCEPDGVPFPSFPSFDPVLPISRDCYRRLLRLFDVGLLQSFKLASQLLYNDRYTVRDTAVLWRFEEPRQEGKTVRFGGFYRLGMKAIVAGPKISRCRGRVRSVELACQRRDGITIRVARTAVRRLSVSLGRQRVDVAELSQMGRILKDGVGVSLELDGDALAAVWWAGVKRMRTALPGEERSHYLP